MRGLLSAGKQLNGSVDAWKRAQFAESIMLLASARYWNAERKRKRGNQGDLAAIRVVSKLVSSPCWNVLSSARIRLNIPPRLWHSRARKSRRMRSKSVHRTRSFVKASLIVLTRAMIIHLGKSIRWSEGSNAEMSRLSRHWVKFKPNESRVSAIHSQYSPNEIYGINLYSHSAIHPWKRDLARKWNYKLRIIMERYRGERSLENVMNVPFNRRSFIQFLNAAVKRHIRRSIPPGDHATLAQHYRISRDAPNTDLSAFGTNEIPHCASRTSWLEDSKIFLQKRLRYLLDFQ